MVRHYEKKKLNTIIKDAIKIAKELGYSGPVIKKLSEASSEAEVTRIMHDARTSYLK